MTVNLSIQLHLGLPGFRRRRKRRSVWTHQCCSHLHLRHQLIENYKSVEIILTSVFSSSGCDDNYVSIPGASVSGLDEFRGLSKIISGSSPHFLSIYGIIKELLFKTISQGMEVTQWTGD